MKGVTGTGNKYQLYGVKYRKQRFLQIRIDF